MSADDSIQPDASTIHRDTAQPVSELSMGPIEGLDELAEANTVIRKPADPGLGDLNAAEQLQPPEQPAKSPAAVAQVLRGKRLNHFLLEDLIGGGGMGAVFRAHDEQLDRVVAIKVIPFVGDDPDLQRRFRNEAQSAAKLDHPNIARVFDVGRHDDWHYIVFEYIRGTNIRDMVHRNGPPSIDDAVLATCRIGEALGHAAERGIVHRDVKPSNVLITESGEYKLVDMGLARSDNLELSEDMTASGVTLGTFDYISPEQARDPRAADVRSDIYSLGCTLYFMLTGRPPYPGGTMLQKLLSHGNSPPPDPRLLRSDVSDDLVAVIGRMLAKTPEQRYQTTADLLADLRAVAERDGLTRAQGGTLAAPARGSVVATRLLQHTPWLASALVLLVVTAWLQVVGMLRNSSATITIPSKAVVVPNSTLPAAIDPTTSMRVDPTFPELPTSDSDALEAGESVGPDEAIATLAAGSDANDDDKDAELGTVTVEEPRISLPTPSPLVSREASLPRNVSPAESAPDESEIVGEYGDEPMGYSPQRLAELDAQRMLEQGRGLVLDAFGALQPSLSEAEAEQPESASAMDGGESPGVAIELIQVVSSDEPSTLPSAPTAMRVTRLEEAIELAARHRVSKIELKVPAIKCGPIQIESDNLQIVSAVGGTTIVLESQESYAMERSVMFDVGSHRVELVDLNLVWKVPTSDVDGGSLFLLNANRRGLRLERCVVTIPNPSRREGVYAFEVNTDIDSSSRSRMGSDSAEPLGSMPLVAIDLSDVIVRGEITMLHMDVATELQFRWTNGLLAVSQRMLDTAGALDVPSPTDGGIQLDLRNLMVHAPLGIGSMRLGVSGRYPTTIDRFAENSVFVVEPGMPLFEITGLEDEEPAGGFLNVRGVSNAYDVELSNPLLRVHDPTGSIVFETLLQDVSRDPPNWFTEQVRRWAVIWSSQAFVDKSPSQLRPDDFVQDGTIRSGFIQKDLPIAPMTGGLDATLLRGLEP